MLPERNLKVSVNAVSNVLVIHLKTNQYNNVGERRHD